MSPLCALHATTVTRRTSIQENGLVGNAPRGRPWGVYVYGENILHNPDRPLQGGPPCRWPVAPTTDVWQVSYIGPVMNDIYVENALILLESVPVTGVTLVTRNSE